MNGPAPTYLGDLVDLPAESPWHDCQPRLCYLPIDQGRWVAEGRAGDISLTAGLFRVEQSLGPGDLVQALNDLVRALGEDPERESSLERALAGLARRQLTRFGGPAALESLPQSLKENHVMLETRIHQWLEDSKAQGLQQGLKQGMDQGRREEACRLLTDLLTQRFGPLPDWAAPRIAAADLATLESWTRGVLRAPDLDSLFDGA